MCSTQTSPFISLLCIWEPPSTIIGIDISEYKVNVTKEGELMLQLSSNDTQFVYDNVTESGVYFVYVVALIGDLVGVVSSTEVKLSDEFGGNIGILDYLGIKDCTIIYNSVGYIAFTMYSMLSYFAEAVLISIHCAFSFKTMDCRTLSQLSKTAKH